MDLLQRRPRLQQVSHHVLTHANFLVGNRTINAGHGRLPSQWKTTSQQCVRTRISTLETMRIEMVLPVGEPTQAAAVGPPPFSRAFPGWKSLHNVSLNLDDLSPDLRGEIGIAAGRLEMLIVVAGRHTVISHQKQLVAGPTDDQTQNGLRLFQIVGTVRLGITKIAKIRVLIVRVLNPAVLRRPAQRGDFLPPSRFWR